MAPRNVDRSRATRQKLIEAARDLFAQRGFADTSIENVLQRTGLSKGALYHQFQDKRDLFRAVFEEVQAELTLRVARGSMATADPTEELWLACEALLDACLDPAIRRIVMLDGPAVLGWDARRPGGADGEVAWLLEHTLEHLVHAGRLAAQPLRPLALMLQGALNEASMAIAHAENPRAAREEHGRSLRQLLAGFVGAPE